MAKSLRWALVAVSLLFAATESISNGVPRTPDRQDAEGASRTPLSIMTYNLKGLPWPIATGRPAALERIAARLADMRRTGRQPHIVLLQEAFIPEAAAIGHSAGYPHAAFGPDAALRSPIDATAADRRYLQDSRPDRGEQWGKSVDSGLVILSDYPIVRVDRLAFPDFACAGYDCLANKGVVVAQVRAPGFARPIAVVDTHLNARAAAGVSIARSYGAFARQVDLLAAFVAGHVRADQSVMIGGDMNIGSDTDRERSFFAAFARYGLGWVTPRSGGLGDALANAAIPDARSRQDLMAAARRRKDWIFARDERGAPMATAQAYAPFGSEADGVALSDHVGYVIDYAPRHRPVILASNDRRAAIGALR